MSDFRPPSFGWCPDWPDLRDYSLQTPAVQRLFSLMREGEQSDKLPPAVDLSNSWGPATDQQAQPTSCAHACLAVLEYFRRRIEGNRSRLSPTFTHQVATQSRNHPRWSDIGLRSTWKAINRFGVLEDAFFLPAGADPVSYPEPFHYASCRRIESLVFFRPTTVCRPGEEKLAVIQAFLAAGIPVICGLSVPNSVTRDSLFDFRNSLEGVSVLGGQAVVLVGYDDAAVVQARGMPAAQRISAFRIRNSWGEAWGDAGYGWLPYDYVLEQQGLVADFWTALAPEWASSEVVTRPNLQLARLTQRRGTAKSPSSSMTADF